MTIFRAQIAITADSALPRDAILITPHYTGTDPTALGTQLKTNIKALTSMASNPAFTISMYDAQGAPPHHPLAVIVNWPATIQK